MPNNTPAPADLVEAVANKIANADLDGPDPDDYWSYLAHAAIGAYQAHMASEEVLQADRDRAASYAEHQYGRVTAMEARYGESLVKLSEAFAAHRRAAAGIVVSAVKPATFIIFDEDGDAEQSTPQSDPRDAVVHEARFLLDRLDELDWSMSFEAFAREFDGHVEPPMARLRANLTTLANSEGKANG